MTVLKNWCELDIDTDKLDLYTDKHDDWNLVFAHHEEEDEISSSLGRAKNYHYQRYFVPYKISIISFHNGITMFL